MIGATFGILAALAVGMVSPGPSFLVVARAALGSSRQSALSVAVGIAVASFVFASVALLGARALLRGDHLVLDVMRLLGGAYLVALGVRLWRSASESPPSELEADRSRSEGNWVGRGFLTQASNPKTMAVYGAVFTEFLPRSPSLATILTLPLLVMTMEGAWYSGIAFAFSGRRASRTYIRARTIVDRVAGAVVGGIGLALIVSAVSARR